LESYTSIPEKNGLIVSQEKSYAITYAKCWATFLAIFSHTHLVTLVFGCILGDFFHRIIWSPWCLAAF
jgi:hypothetical protein